MKTNRKFFNNHALTFNAKGVIAYLSTNAITTFEINDIMTVSPQSKDAISRILNELVASYYLIRTDTEAATDRNKTSRYTMSITQK